MESELLQPRERKRKEDRPQGGQLEVKPIKSTYGFKESPDRRRARIPLKKQTFFWLLQPINQATWKSVGPRRWRHAWVDAGGFIERTQPLNQGYLNSSCQVFRCTLYEEPCGYIAWLVSTNSRVVAGKLQSKLIREHQRPCWCPITLVSEPSIKTVVFLFLPIHDNISLLLSILEQHHHWRLLQWSATVVGSQN